MAKPNPGKIPQSNLPVLSSNTPKDTKWTFSFQYFKEIDNFGLSGVSNSWFSSLLSKLREVSSVTINEFTSNHTTKADWRYHAINWQAKNIPLQKSQLTWIDEEITSNDEFVFYQFQISMALGRVVGFWYEATFYIVLLDPLHNIQPAKINSYKIRHNKALETDISLLLDFLDEVKQVPCKHDCDIKQKLNEGPLKKKESNAVMLFLDDEFLEELYRLTEIHTITHIVQTGIANL